MLRRWNYSRINVCFASSKNYNVLIKLIYSCMSMLF